MFFLRLEPIIYYLLLTPPKKKPLKNGSIQRDTWCSQSVKSSTPRFTIWRDLGKNTTQIIDYYGIHSNKSITYIHHIIYLFTHIYSFIHFLYASTYDTYITYICIYMRPMWVKKWVDDFWSTVLTLYSKILKTLHWVNLITFPQAPNSCLEAIWKPAFVVTRDTITLHPDVTTDLERCHCEHSK